MNISILVGTSEYQKMENLPCCIDDLVEIEKLLKASEKYSKIEYVKNQSAGEIKSKIREVLEGVESIEELFFYYTGHGLMVEEEFFFCASNFDKHRPNETGLSNSELHNLLKSANAELVVKVIDACNSGIPLVKGDHILQQQYKSEFGNLVQIASCLNSQNSLTGDPLSLFTEKFRNAALRKTEGIILYSDIINTLKDDFLNNENQTPHFVHQGTYREKFVEDASVLAELRSEIAGAINPQNSTAAGQDAPLQTDKDLLTRLQEIENKIATKEEMNSFIGKFFENLIVAISSLSFTDYFELQVDENSYFTLSEEKEFIVSVLSKEKRHDEFVTARVRRVRKERKRRPVSRFALSTLYSNQFVEYETVHDLFLNMSLEKIQINFSFIPKFSYLKKVNLMIICAPSIDCCYVFEIAKRYTLTDFGEFDNEGEMIIQGWKKLKWDSEANILVEEISKIIKDSLDSHLDELSEKLN